LNLKYTPPISRKEEEQDMETGLKVGLDFYKTDNITQDQLDSLVMLNRILTSAMVELIKIKNEYNGKSIEEAVTFNLAPDYENFLMELNVYHNPKKNDYVVSVKLLKSPINH